MAGEKERKRCYQGKKNGFSNEETVPNGGEV